MLCVFLYKAFELWYAKNSSPICATKTTITPCVFLHKALKCGFTQRFLRKQLAYLFHDYAKHLRILRQHFYRVPQFVALIIMLLILRILN